MKQRTLYQCEVCGTEYSIPEAAAWCESQPELPPCPVKAGDAVDCYVYGGPPERDEVVSVKVAPFGTFVVEGWIRDNRFSEFVERHGSGPTRFHEWAVTVKNEHFMFDDPYTYASELDLGHVWLPGESKSINGTNTRKADMP